MKNYFDSTDVINLINDLKLDIKELWCYVKELAARIPVNIGNGIGIFKQLYRNKWEFKSLVAGNNITITDNGDDITISSTGGGSFNCSDLNSCSTDNLPEGSNNLYFTDNRAITALTGQNISIFNNDAGYITSNFISSVNDTSSVDLDVTSGVLTANVVGTPYRIPYFDLSGNITSDTGFTRDYLGVTTKIYADETNIFGGIFLNGAVGQFGYSSNNIALNNYYYANSGNLGWTIGANTWTLPTSDGSNGQVLTTDGLGQLSFTTISPSNYISSVSDTATIDLTVVGSNLSADFIGTTSNIPEGSNLYYTDIRARNAISLTTTGSGAATYNSTTGILNIPTNTAPVTSVFGRTGIVTAQSGDYTGTQVTNSPSGWVTATDTQSAINQIASFLNPSNTWYFFTDFEGGGNSAATLNSDKIAVGFLGANVTSTILTTSESGAVGVMSIGTGTTSTGAVFIGTNTGVFSFGDGITLSEIRVKLPVLSDGTNRFTIRVGFVNSATGDSINGAYFRYVDNVNSGNWQLITRSGGVETAVNTATTVVANTWIKLSVLTDATASLVTYSVNGVSVGTINSNIGTTNIGMGMSIVKSAGTTASLLYCDYQLGMKTFTSAR